jgi:hypothetical protein
VLRLARAISGTTLVATLLAGCGGAGASGLVGDSPFAPSPSTAAVASPSPVGDRAGVPAELHDRVWFTSAGEVGLLGTRLERTLPAGETPIAAGNGEIASAVLTDKDVEGGATRLVVRRVGDWSTIWQGTSAIWITHAAFAGGVLLWTGRTYGGSRDGGVWANTLTSGSEPVAVIPAAATAGGASPPERGPFVVSPSGRTVAIGMGSVASSTPQLIDVPSLTVRPSALEGRTLGAITEDLALSTESALDGARDLVGLEVKGGSVTGRWHLGAPGTVEAIVVAEDRAYVEFQRGEALVLIRIAFAGGPAVEIGSWNVDDSLARSHLASGLSSAGHLVLLSDLDLEDALAATADHRATVDLVDTASPGIEEAAFAIGAP